MGLQVLGHPRCREEGRGGEAAQLVQFLALWALWAGAKGVTARLSLRPMAGQVVAAGTLVGAAVGLPLLASRAAAAPPGTAALPSPRSTPRA